MSSRSAINASNVLEPDAINGRIENFKRDLGALEPIHIVRKHIINGGCFAIQDPAYSDLRSLVAEKYEIHPNEVLIVGSSKLGFSIAPTKQYRHFSDTSDIDLVLVSDRLFDRIWKSVHYFWDHGGYWERAGDFKNYLFRGWIRPDKLPSTKSFALATEWWEFFNSLSSGDRYSAYKIRGALYKDWYFLEAYQIRGVSACIEALRPQEVSVEDQRDYRRLRILLTGVKQGTLVPRPEFQRRLVWTNKHKQDFIETVLMEYPFPEIYIAAGDVDPDTGAGTELLVDGQQRITTLYQYFTGSDDLRLGKVRPYSALTGEEKLAFLEYEVVVRDLGKRSIEEIKQVFTRINSTKYSLNAMEIHNARFDGAFKRFAEQLSDDEFFDNYRVFKTNDIRRMGDLVFCITLAITVMTTYFNRDDDIEEFLEKYNDDFPNAYIRNELQSVFRLLDECHLDPRSRAWRKAELLNLLVELHRAHIRERKHLDPKVLHSNLSKFFARVDQAGAGQPEAEEVTSYYKAAIQATNDRSNRIRRGHIISKVLREEITL